MLRVAPLVLLCLLAGACSGPIETRIESAGISGLAPSHFQVADVPDGVSDRARDAIVGRLEKMGFQRAAAGDYLLETGFSSKPASLEVKAGQGDNSKPLSTGKTRKPFQSCVDVEHRLTMVLTQVSDGSLAYRASAAEYHCRADADTVLPHLVDAVMTGFGNPKGKVVLKRIGVE